MTNYRYLGYGVTNENGIAKLEYNSEGQKRDHSYTGVGAGEIDVLASLDNPIVEGSIVSEPCSVWDTIKYDNGTDSTHNIWSVSPDASIDYSSGEYALFSKTATGNKYAQCTLSEQSVCFEFEVYLSSGYRTSTFFRVSSSTEPLYSCQLQNISHYTGEWVKCRLTMNNGNITFEDVEDSTKKHTSTYTGSLASFQFSLMGSDFTSMRFKNFKVYSI